MVLAADGLQTGLVLVVQWLGFAGSMRDGSSSLLCLPLLLLLNLFCRLLSQQVLRQVHFSACLMSQPCDIP